MRRRIRSMKLSWIVPVALGFGLVGCADLVRDVDLSPFYRSATHPHPAFTETDVLGPFVPWIHTEERDKYGLRPLFMTEHRPWAEGADGERETVVSFLAPFGKYHSNPRTTQVRFSPLVWFTRERTGQGGLDTDFILFPFVWVGRSDPPPGAAGVGETAERHLALFPLIGQLSEFIGYQRMQFLAWPILQRLTKRTYFDDDQVEPAEEHLTSIALLAGWTTGWPRGGSWHILPFFSRSVWNYPPYRAPKYPDGADPSQPLPYYDKRIYLWPFIHDQRLNLDRGPGKETRQLAVWPFFKHETGIDHEFWTILWPFFRYNREWPLVRESAVAKRELDGPVPESVAKAPENTNVLIDILTQAIFRYERTDTYQRKRIGLLLYADYESLPADKPDRLESVAFLQPIGYWKRHVTERTADGGYDDDSLWAGVPFFQSHLRRYVDAAGNYDGRSDRFWRLWPMFSYERNADGSRNIYAIPLLPLRLERFVMDFNDALEAFFNIYRYQRASDAQGGFERHTALFTLIRAYRDDKETSLSIPLLFTSRNVTEGDVRSFSRRFLFGMFGYEGEDGPDHSTRALRLFWLPVRLS